MNIETATSRDILEEFGGPAHAVHTLIEADVGQKYIDITCSCDQVIRIDNFDIEITSAFGQSLTLKHVAARIKKLGKDKNNHPAEMKK